MAGRRSGYFDNRMQMEARVKYRCKKCGKQVQHMKVFDTLAPPDETVRAMLRPLLAEEVEHWKEWHRDYCDDCRPATWSPTKWPRKN